MNGFSRKDDLLPERFFTMDGSSGDGVRVTRLDREEFSAALANYYSVRGLDEDGMPLEEKCRNLGIPWNS